jgi:hypothetical protein
VIDAYVNGSLVQRSSRRAKVESNDSGTELSAEEKAVLALLRGW